MAEIQEFPKHVTVGKTKDGAPVTKIAQNAGEEAAILATVPAAGAPELSREVDQADGASGEPPSADLVADTAEKAADAGAAGDAAATDQPETAGQ